MFVCVGFDIETAVVVASFYIFKRYEVNLWKPTTMILHRLNLISIFFIIFHTFLVGELCKVEFRCMFMTNTTPLWMPTKGH